MEKNSTTSKYNLNILLYMKRSITILLIIFCLVNCYGNSQKITNSDKVATVTDQQKARNGRAGGLESNKPATILLSLRDFPKMDRSIKFSGKFDIYQDKSEISYFDGNEFQYINIDKYPATKNISIPCTSNYLLLRCRYNFFDFFDYLIQKGDSLTLSSKQGLPYVQIYNRPTKEFDNNIDYYRISKYLKDKYSVITKYNEPIFFLPSVENSPEKNKPLIKKLRGELAPKVLSMLIVTDKILDSLQAIDKISEKVYMFFKSRTYSQRQQLSVLEGKIDTSQIKSTLRYKWLTSELPLLYHHYLSESMSDYFFTDKASKLDLKDGVNRDYREIYQRLSTSVSFPDSDKKWLLTRELRRIANTFGNEDFKKYYTLFDRDVPDSTLKNQIRREFSVQLLPSTLDELEIILMRPDQTTTTLSEILKHQQGKILYVDFWASWCAPCREGMKFSTFLRHELADKNITFIYLSIDKTINPWQKANQKEGLAKYPDTYLVVESEGFKNFCREQKLTSIPHYMIFDRQAKLVYAKAPRVDSREIKPLLLKLAQ